MGTGTELAKSNGGGVGGGLWQPSKNEIAIITNSICPGAGRDELAWFLNVCTNSGLNPIKGQIYMLVTDSQKWGRKVNVYTSLSGYLLIARESGTFDGFSGPWVYDEEGNEYKVLPKGKQVHAVRVQAHVRGVAYPFEATVLWSEFGERNCKYYEDRKTGERVPSNNWSKMPVHMLTKVAKSHALRQAYPDRLSVPVQEELGMSDEEISKYTVKVGDSPSQAATPPPPPRPTTPPAQHEAPVDETPSSEQDPEQEELHRLKADVESLAAEYASDAGATDWEAVKGLLGEDFPWAKKYPKWEKWDKGLFQLALRYLNEAIVEDAQYTSPAPNERELLDDIDF